MNNYNPNAAPTPNLGQMPFYETVIDEVKSYPLFYFTEFILPIILLIPTIINFSKLNSYTLYE